jgi:hypothetical protein
LQDGAKQRAAFRRRVPAKKISGGERIPAGYSIYPGVVRFPAREPSLGAMKMSDTNEYITSSEAYASFVSLKHLSQSHIMPRTLPVVVIIFAACMGLPQH